MYCFANKKLISPIGVGYPLTPDLSIDLIGVNHRQRLNQIARRLSKLRRLGLQEDFLCE